MSIPGPERDEYIRSIIENFEAGDPVLASFGTLQDVVEFDYEDESAFAYIFDIVCAQIHIAEAMIELAKREAEFLLAAREHHRQSDHRGHTEDPERADP